MHNEYTMKLWIKWKKRVEIIDEFPKDHMNFGMPLYNLRLFQLR